MKGGLGALRSSTVESRMEECDRLRDTVIMNRISSNEMNWSKMKSDGSAIL
jgi:hypothetical protein